VRLEGRTEDCHAHSRVVAATELGDQVDDPVATALVDAVHLTQESQRLAQAEFLSARPEGADVLGQAPSAEADPGPRNLRPIRSSWPIASASLTTSPPAASQISAMALMNEIFVARNELAAVLTISAVT
jgi:hypothetical protein